MTNLLTELDRFKEYHHVRQHRFPAPWNNGRRVEHVNQLPLVLTKQVQYNTLRYKNICKPTSTRIK